MFAGLADIAAVAATVWIALAVDRWFGEPPARWHPVVWMGSYLGAAGRRIAPRAGAAGTPLVPNARAVPFVLGALAWCAGAAMAGGSALLLQQGAWSLPAWAAVLFSGFMLKPLLAWRMLRDEVLAVESALDVSLDAGRARLARLVSRDVGALTEAEVRESAIESLAENLNDSVVAPVFWFLLLGLPGAAIYRFANTADAMWGYIGERGGRDWTWAGKWAARADDALSWIPARLTALLLHGFFAIGVKARSRRSLRTLCREARRTPSPNSGWPMAAMAIGLGVRLGKPGVYALNATAAEPRASDTAGAARAGSGAVGVLCVGAAVVPAAAAAVARWVA